jgi:hypothetical protein
MADIFLSYSSEDRERVRPIVSALQAFKYTVFWDPHVKPGERWTTVIEAELKKARCVVVVWSQRSVSSHWVKEEAHHGLERDVLVPILIDDVARDIPLGFKQVQSASLVGVEDSELSSHPAFLQLLEKLRELRGLPQARLPATPKEPSASRRSPRPKLEPIRAEPSLPMVADSAVDAYVVAPGTPHLYRAPVPRFLEDLDAGGLPEQLVTRFEALEGGPPSEGEFTAWKNSLPALAEVLRDERLRRSEIFVELWMPIRGRRCDALLTGYDLEGSPASVVVELKQWTTVGKSPWREEVWVANDSRPHPSAQVRDYVTFLRYYHSAFVKEGVRIKGCVWLHGMEEPRSITRLRDPDAFGDLFREYPVFVKREQSRFADWLHDQLGHGEGTRAAALIAAGRPQPSEKLLDMVVQTIRGEFEWRLLDVQRQAYLRIITAVEEGRTQGTRTVVLVKGGPGTGKSVLALQLLAHGASKHWRVVHATGSQAFQTNLQGKTLAFSAELHRKLQGVRFKKELPVEELFCTFAEVAKAGASAGEVLDLVVADEAHRLWDFRRLKFPNGTIRRLSETPMIEEVIRASRVTAFFLDDNQAVRAGEIGHSSVVREAAQRLGVRLVEMELDLQFRCSGSESYIRWVDALLGFRDSGDLAWRDQGAYALGIQPDMKRMDQLLRSLRNQGYRCRIVAGYCWTWSKPVGEGSAKLVDDVKDKRFGGWSAPWIEKTGQGRKPLENQYYRWANEDDYYEQVGSIYSVQGFEFDYVGVIWGEDLVWRTDRWVADLSKNKDKTFKRDVRQSGEDPVAKLRNVYRVLLTRGMRGTHLFVLDAETREHIEALLKAQHSTRVA